jgi:hypothetical protein
MIEYELKITERPQRNRRTGRFMKGSVPANKGKRWDDYMPKQSQKRSKRGWKNLRKYGKKGAGAGWNKRAVVAITADGTFVGRFESGAEAAHCSGAHQRNINCCCRKQRKHAGKTADGRLLQWFYETDDTWIELVLN